MESRAPWPRQASKKALSFEAVRLASQERVQQRLQGLRAADGGSVEGSAEDSGELSSRSSVSSLQGLRKLLVKLGFFGIAQNGTTTESEVDVFW